MSKCIQPLPNGDMLVNERICLMIDNSVFLSEHRQTYNFPGGKVPLKCLKKKIGCSSLRELGEEIGICIKPKYYFKKVRLLSWCLDKRGCFRMLLFVRIKQKHLNFVKASHVWETKNFTLVPLDKNYEKTYQIGMYIENNIKKINNECAKYIKYSNGEIETVFDQINGKNISKINGDYYIKLINNPKLTTEETESLKYINKKINGYEDDQYVFEDDYICKFEYKPFGKKIEISISVPALFRAKIHIPDMTYEDLIVNNKKHLLKIDEKRSIYLKYIKKLIKMIS